MHRYANWPSERKNRYDDFPELHVVFTGSSLIHIEKIIMVDLRIVKCLYANTKGIGLLQKLYLYHPIDYSAIGDFRVGKHLFEIGGKSKSKKQLPNEQNAYIVTDYIVIGHKNQVLLWLSGFLY